MHLKVSQPVSPAALPLASAGLGAFLGFPSFGFLPSLPSLGSLLQRSLLPLLALRSRPLEDTSAGAQGAAAMLMGPSTLLKLSCCESVVNQRIVLGI